MIDLWLFSVDTALVNAALQGGLRGTIVDWEHAGKHERQRGFDTQINSNTLDDLERVAQQTPGPVICRINAVGEHTAGEVQAALAAGANELLVPMVRDVASVERVLRLVGERAAVGILIETEEAVAATAQLTRLPLSRIYVGLMDLAIARRSRHIFLPIVDGTLERVRDQVTVPFGWGGLTLPDLGLPIPSRLLLEEMARLDSRFTFLRRSFLRDVQPHDVGAATARIVTATRAAFAARRTTQNPELVAAVAALDEATLG